MYEPRWVRPRTIEEAVAALAENPSGARPIAGATDLAVRIRAEHDGPGTLIDLTGVGELAEIGVDTDTLSIGATATHAAVARHEVVRERAAVLARACASVGGPQIRARGTIGGNLANASPAADSAVALAALGAVAHARSARGERSIPLSGLFAGPGITVLEPDELLTRVTVELPPAGSRSAYAKLGQRRALAIAIASVAASFDPRAGRVRIALGSVAPTVVRAASAETAFAEGWRALDGGPVEGSGRGGGADVASAVGADLRRIKELLEEVAALAVDASCPIDDVRASAEYRTILVGELTLTALEEMVLGGSRASG